ncbi:MAG: sulfatase-like hydrolase/transferase [Candidatus Aminicenantes bacterium]|nr:sulfatase-like hydrolase/transferase [Candidatus Aminicenantes bacterium]
MKHFRMALALSAVLLVPRLAGATESNVLLITIDTLRPDRLSCYSAAFVKTPEIDGLAARGALFERAYAHNPTTLPSHANILTGMTPPFHGVSENSKSKLPEACLTLAELFRAKGYATAAFIGAFPLDSRFGLDQGFDIYDDSFPPPPSPARMGTSAERRAGEVIKAASAWIAGRQGKWFCWVHLFDPHAPYAPPEPFLSRYKADPYSGEAAYVDSELGRFFQDLKRSGLLERTFIVLTADHGESLGEHGELTHSYFAYNSTIRVPLVIAGPGIGPARVGPNVSHSDIFPTLCEFNGIPAPGGLQGRSLAGLMKGGKRAERPIYFESLEPYLNKGCAPLRGFIEGQLKYMDSPVPELYDLAADLNEKTSLAAGRYLGPFKKKLADLIGSLASPLSGTATRPADSRTLEKLRSLGYVATPVAKVRAAYGAADDVKNFLPFQQRLERAILLSDGGDAQGGIREFAALAAERKDFAPAFIYLSQAFAAQGRVSDAIAALEEGVSANPDDYSLLSSLGRLLVRARQYDRAAEVLGRALAIMDFDPTVWDDMGIVAMRKGDYANALEYLAKAVELDRTFALAFSNIGAVRLEMYSNQGRKADDLTLAIESFRKAVALDPALGLAWRGLGVACRMNDDIAGAIDAWERAVAADPADSYSRLNLGRAYLGRGDKSRARAAFEKYLEVRGPGIPADERAMVLALIEKCK